MAVLKQTSPTALPVAPRPCPAMTVPSSSTRRAVRGTSVQGCGAFIVCPNGLGREIRSGVSQDVANSAAGPQFAPETRGTDHQRQLRGIAHGSGGFAACDVRLAPLNQINKIIGDRDAREDQRRSEGGDEGWR